MTAPRFLKTISGQITGLIIFSVILSLLLTFGVTYLFANSQRGQNFFGGGERNQRRPGEPFQVMTVARLADAAQSQQALRAIVDAAQRSGIDVRLLPRSSGNLLPLPAAGTNAGRPPFPGGREFGNRMRFTADHAMELKLLSGPFLLMPMPPRPGLPIPWHLLTPLLFILTMIAAVLVGLSLYAARSIVSPLLSFSDAAHSMGRTAKSGHRIPERGPAEVVHLAQALNQMNTRIRSLLDERTNMLTAISHDIRTPLTRLKLRAERVEPIVKSREMLADVAHIEQMLTETLIYLRGEIESEPTVYADLPSILETICTEWADLGKDIVYTGPGELTYLCQVSAMTRALNNLIDNAIKYGSKVSVSLAESYDGTVIIKVADDGPGIPYSLQARVFEPFFKIDTARSGSAREGFGLGLSVARNVIEGHGGRIELIDTHPSGTTVSIALPSTGVRRTETNGRAQTSGVL